MKKTLLVMLLTGAFMQINAQESLKLTNVNEAYYNETGYVRCYTDENQERLEANSPNRTSNAEFENWMGKQMQILRKNRVAGVATSNVYTIPVVVHVIHNGDAVGKGENITDAQVLSQIKVMNDDYRRKENTRGGANTTGKAVDIEINFCMAAVDPDGKPTNGIDRVDLGKASFGSIDEVENAKKKTYWDPSKYLNMWTVKFGGKAEKLLGYAQFPDKSGLQGMEDNGGDASTDGVVAVYDAFGSKDEDDGTFVLKPSFAYGRTMTHEVGHWLGLRHVWGDGDCDKDDFCDDTPVTGKFNTGCDKNADTCPRKEGKDMVQNYLDYTNDDCMDTFTQDQKERMQIVMSKSPRRKELNDSKVCSALSINDVTFKNNLKLYPNPGNNFVNLVVNNDNNIPTAYKIYDLAGRAISSKTITSNSDLKINTSNLTSGVYFIKVEKASAVATLKFIKE